MLKWKRNRDTFNHRIKRLAKIPKEVKRKFTLGMMSDDFSNTNLILTFPSKTNPSGESEIKSCIIKDEQNIKFESSITDNHNKEESNEEIPEIIQEVEEIVNELEIFYRENRKAKMISLISKMAEYINDDLIDEEELTDHLFFGDKQSNIEKEYMNSKINKSINDIKLCAETNRMLEEDNIE